MEMFSLGQRIRELRLKKGLTQVDLGKGICTSSMISQIESDRARPSYKMLFAIGERLGVTLDRLLLDVEMNLEAVSLFRMARAMVAGKEYATAIPLLRELIEMPRAQVSQIDLLLDLGECLLHTGAYAEAEQTLLQVQEVAVVRRDARVAALVLRHLGQLEYARKRYSLAVYLWTKGLQEADKMEEPDSYLRAGLLYLLGEAHTKVGQREQALTSLEEAARMYEGLDSLYEMGHAYLGLGISYQKAADLERSVEYSNRAIGIFEGLDNLLMTLEHQVTCATLYGQTGRVDEAEEMFTGAIRQLRELGRTEELGRALVEYAAFCQTQGRIGEAEAACMEARGVLPELHVYQARLSRVLARVDLERDEQAQAIRRYQAAADAFAKAEEVGEWGDTLHELSLLYARQNEYAEALRILDHVRTETHVVMEQRGIAL